MTDPLKPPRSAFGEWLACADGKAHYSLAGTFNCGTLAPTTGAPVFPSKKNRAQPAVSLCRGCIAGNWARWAKGGAA